MAKSQYAGFWRRLLASILDSFVLAAASLIATPFGGIAVGWLYSAFMESSKYQATLGKMALGMKVTDESGKRISFGRATGRHFAKILSTITFGIGFLMIAFTGKKQGLHDILARTLVVRGK